MTMKASAFAPAHISGFFEPVYHTEDIEKTGSRGAGINLSLGALSEVAVAESTKQQIEIFINNRKSQDPVTTLAIKYLIRENPLHVNIRTRLDLPTGQGFGMSAACALSATYALTKIVGISNNEALKASHFAEVKLRTGLGDAMASSFGGIEIRKTPGLPPWGVIEHIPGNFNIVLCIIGRKMDTKKVLEDNSKLGKIVEYGSLCTKKILDNPSVENLFKLSQTFTEKTNLADNKVIQAINAANQFGMASMCMLGNSIFAIGKTEQLCKVLSPFGKVSIGCVDESGARVL
jgi:pantoate kinase